MKCNGIDPNAQFIHSFLKHDVPPFFKKLFGKGVLRFVRRKRIFPSSSGFPDVFHRLTAYDRGKPGAETGLIFPVNEILLCVEEFHHDILHEIVAFEVVEMIKGADEPDHGRISVVELGLGDFIAVFKAFQQGFVR